MKLDQTMKRLFSQWPAKVLSLAVALLLTLFFNLTRLEQRLMSIPLAVSMHDSMAASSAYPRMVKVVLRGERDVIYGIREDEISASVDLSSYREEGVFKVPIRLEKRGGAVAADPLEIRPDPSEIAIGLERRVAKRLPVTPSFKGFLESGYELASFDISPSEVVLSGPAGLMARSAEISTDTIELSGKRGDFSVEVRLIKKDSLMSFEGRDSVLFSAKIKRSLDVKEIAKATIMPRGLSPSLALAEPLPTGSLRLHLPGGYDSPIDSRSLLYVDFSGLGKPGTYTVEVGLSLPDQAILEAYEPQSLTVRLISLSQQGGSKLSGSIRSQGETGGASGTQSQPPSASGPPDADSDGAHP
ncbi:MAG TPA: CdaR family protein [Rectinemataceae bacterium]